jgi:hypothetical protein
MYLNPKLPVSQPKLPEERRRNVRIKKKYRRKKT